jgi:hypothetical protein
LTVASVEERLVKTTKPARTTLGQGPDRLLALDQGRAGGQAEQGYLARRAPRTLSCLSPPSQVRNCPSLPLFPYFPGLGVARLQRLVLASSEIRPSHVRTVRIFRPCPQIAGEQSQLVGGASMGRGLLVRQRTRPQWAHFSTTYGHGRVTASR